MKKFAYKVIEPDGMTSEGEIEVNTEKELETFFLKGKLTPVRVVEKKVHEEGQGSTFRDFFKRKLLESELIAFTRQFAAAYGAGISISNTLDLLAKQASHESFREAIQAISKKIQSGKGLTESFIGFPRFFDQTYCAILNSGEVSGNLDTVLNYSAGLLEKKLLHRERIRSTFLYPKLVLGMIVVTIAVVVVFVIPQFAKLYEKFEAPLPLPTLLMVKFSNFVVHSWWLWILFLISTPFLIRNIQKNKRIMLWVHEQVVDMPLLGLTFLKIELTHFCTTFALLLRSGIRITDATQIAIQSMKNTFMREQLQVIIPTIEQGGTLASSLEKVKMVPPLMTSMIAIGEYSGTLDSLLDRVAGLFDHETDLMLKKLPTLLEPIILGFLFVLVFMLALAVYLPMWKMASLIRR